MHLTTILMEISGDNLLAALLDDSFGLLIFGIALIGIAVLLRRVFNRHGADETSEKH